MTQNFNSNSSVNSYSTATSASTVTEITKDSNQAWAEMMKKRINSVKSRQMFALHDLETTLRECKKVLAVLTESLDALEKQRNWDLKQKDLKYKLDFKKTTSFTEAMPTVNYTLPEFNNSESNNPVQNGRMNLPKNN